jgi:L-ascorbate metabolism protein UlaG (beta-lactamase superfamily)
MKLTYYGHACFLLETQGKRVLFDPFISPNPAAAHMDVNSMEADFILLSHGHEDHVADAEAIARRTNAPIVATFEVANWFAAKDLQVMHMNHGGSLNLGFGTVKMVAAVHSSVLPDGSYGGNPAGFVISNDEGTLYFAGDTALTLDMQLIARQFKVDVALLPIGDVFTMGVVDAVIAAEFVACDQVIGMHFNTFPPIQIDPEAARKAFSDAGKTLTLMDIGSTWER